MVLRPVAWLHFGPFQRQDKNMVVTSAVDIVVDIARVFIIVTFTYIQCDCRADVVFGDLYLRSDW